MTNIYIVTNNTFVLPYFHVYSTVWLEHALHSDLGMSHIKKKWTIVFYMSTMSNLNISLKTNPNCSTCTNVQTGIKITVGLEDCLQCLNFRHTGLVSHFF